MSEGLQDRLRAAIRADGRPIAEIAKQAGLSGPNVSRFLGGTVGVSFDNGERLAIVVNMTIGPAPAHSRSDTPEIEGPIPDAAEVIQVAKCCQCGLPVRSTPSPGTELAIRKAKPMPSLTNGPSTRPIAESRPKLTDYEKNRNRKLGMYVPDA